METRLHDELLLLAYDDDEGTAAIGTPTLDYALAGALLTELALAGRVDVVDKRVVVRSPEPIGDDLADEVLATLVAEKARKPQDWIGKFASGLRERLLDRQVEAGVLRREKGRVLWVFPRTTYPSVEGMPDAERDARRRLRAAVAGASTHVDDRTAALCGLVLAAGLERVAVDSAEGRDRAAERAARDRLKEIAEGDWAAKAVRTAIDEMQAAIAVAASVGTTVTIITTTSS